MANLCGWQVAEQAGEVADDVKKFSQYSYPNMTRTQVESDFYVAIAEEDLHIRVMLVQDIFILLLYDVTCTCSQELPVIRACFHQWSTSFGMSPHLHRPNNDVRRLRINKLPKCSGCTCSCGSCWPQKHLLKRLYLPWNFWWSTFATLWERSK